MIKKIILLLKEGYNPYPFYWFDLLTERHLKYRKGECVDCFDCCKYDEFACCEHVEINQKRCKIYNNRNCDQWFPISPKELEFMKSWKPWMNCKYSFDYKNKKPR